MPVTLKASVEDKGVKLALSRLGSGISSEKVAKVAVMRMVDPFLQDVFEQNLYGWPAVNRGGMPLFRGQGTASRIVSGFVWAVSGSVGRIHNLFGYAHIHDKGATITAKNERTVVQHCTSKKGKKFTRTVKMKVLAFQVNKKWVHAKSVTIPQRRFMYWPFKAVAFVKKSVEEYIRVMARGR